MPLPDLAPVSAPALMLRDQASLVIIFAIVACVAITAIVACVIVILGLKAIGAAQSQDVPKTVDTLMKGAGVFARFLPTGFLTDRALNGSTERSPRPTDCADGTSVEERPDA